MPGLRFYDACAGMGGFRLGMERAGHIYVGSCEIDKYARKAYEAIHGAPPTHSDIRKVNPDELPDFNVLCAGFPCQAFSRAGYGAGFDDTRGTIIFELLRIAEAKTPDYLLFENVRALLTHGRWQTFETILRALDDLGYDAEWQVLNSKHFGVPQNRERVYLVGHSRKSRTRGVFPIIGESDGAYDRLTAEEMQDMGLPDRFIREATRENGGSHIEVHKPTGITRTIRHEGGGDRAPWVVVRDKYGGYVEAAHGDAVVIEKYDDEHALRLVGDYALALDANYWKGLDRHGQRTAVLDGHRVRRLTPRECFRLQGIPDDVFDRAANVVSKTQLYKMAGNGLTVPVVYEIAKRLGVAA